MIIRKKLMRITNFQLGFVFVLGLVFLLSTNVFAQFVDASELAQRTARLTAQEFLREVSVDKLEIGDQWSAYISPDDGLALTRSFQGGPNAENGKVYIDQEPDENVIGVRVDYFRRSVTTIFLTRIRPKLIEGITKTISFWVAGRNYNHFLNIHVLDYSGRSYKIPVGSLNFSGWRQMAVSIPETIQQTDFYRTYDQGIQFVGFSIEPSLVETYGNYFVYFDDLRAWTDTYALEAGINLNDIDDRQWFQIQ